MKKLLALLACLCLLSACKLTAKDLPKVLDFAESRRQDLPEDFTKLMATSSPQADRLLTLFVAYGELKGLTIQFVSEQLQERGVMGLYWHGHVLVNADMGSEAQLATLVHEMGHACSSGEILLQTHAEVVAESIAFLVLQDVKKIDVNRFSIAYLLHMAPSGTRAYVYSTYGELIQSCSDDMRSVLEE